MTRRAGSCPTRILMTVDAVGGVWQYALSLSAQLIRSGCTVVLAGLGPLPSCDQKRSAERVATVTWLRTPPDWIAGSERALRDFGGELSRLVHDHAVDVVQVNEPGQATHLELRCPVVAVSHSCIGTWFRAVRGTRSPADWTWQEDRTRAGLNRADLVVAPSKSHAAAVAECYGALPRLVVVHNAVAPSPLAEGRDSIVFAAGRWWDAGKNGDTLDRAAARAVWPIFAAGAVVGPNGDEIEFRNVIALGPLTHSETRALGARCSIFVSPSIYEPFGLAALEAATAGTPLLLADIPTYRELWSDAAIFFAPQDAEALAERINLLAGDDLLRQSLGSAAKRRSRSYNLARQTRAMRSAYDRASDLRAMRA